MSVSAVETPDLAHPAKAVGTPRLPITGIVVVAAVIALYAPLFVEMAHKWLNDEYSAHGLFIPFMSAALLFWKRREIAEAPRAPSFAGLALLIPGLALDALSWHYRMPVLVSVSLAPVLLGLTLLLCGKRMLRILWFPIAFLVFATPMPRWMVQPISLPIQTISAKSAFWTVKTMGVPMVENGFTVSLPNTTVEVAESCSGFKKAISLMVFAGFYASLFAIPAWRQLALVVAALPFALIANIVRVVGLILAGAWLGDRGVHIFHDGSEIVVLGLCFMMLLGAGRLAGCKKVRYMA